MAKNSENIKDVDIDWVTWVEKERAIKEAKEAIIESKMAKLPIQGLTFSELNKIWDAQKEIIRTLDHQDRTNRSLDTINNTVFNVYLWVLQFISFVPFISLGIIGYDVITDFSMWNLFTGFLWQIGIVASTKILKFLIILIVGYGIEKVEAENRVLNEYSILEAERVTHEITPESGLIYCYCNDKFLIGHSIKRMHEEAQKRKEGEILTFEEKVLKLIEVHAPESKIVNGKFLKEIQMIKKLSAKRNLSTEKYLELIADLAEKVIENTHYKSVLDTNSLRLKN